MPYRIQRKRTKGWRMPPDAIYVGRPTRWGNPFQVSDDRKVIGPDGRETVVVHGLRCLAPTKRSPPRWFLTHAYVAWLSLPEQAELRQAIRAELANHNLACWCPIGDYCHADTLLRLANTPGARPKVIRGRGHDYVFGRSDPMRPGG